MKINNLGGGKMVKRIGAGLLLLALTALPAAAQTSAYQTMTLTGDFSGFDAGRNNMVLVSNNTWEITISLTAANKYWFKFAANGSYTINWGHTATNTFTVPFTSTATTNSAHDIYIAPIQEGIYRFRFNSSTRQYWVDFMGLLPENANLLRNAGFETAGSSDFDAYYWERNVPDVFGDNWGNSFREDYRQRSGFWMGAVGADPINFGGWYQDVTFLPDYEYVFKGYFYIDPAWTAAVQEVKVEFFDNAYNFVGQESLTLTGLTNSWQLRTFTATPPFEANWARTVINVSGAGTKGTLEFDDLEVTARSKASQNFDTWDFASAAGQHSRGGWLVSTGYVVVGDLARAIRSAALKNDTASPTNGGFIQSGMLTSGVGTVSFFYRHGWTNEETSPSGPILLDIETSADGTNFTAVYTITNVLNAGYQNFTRQFNFAAQKFLRIHHKGGSTNTVIIDDITIGVPSSVTLFQDFDNWPVTTSTNGSHTFGGWLVRSGKVITAGAYAGQSALIAPSTNSFTNSITSVLYSNGVGDISFNYARGTNGVGPANLAIQISSNGTTWQTIDTIEQILDPGYATYNNSYFFYSPQYVRILNLYSPSTGNSSGLVLIDEGFATNTPSVGWVYNDTGYYTSDSSSGVAIPSIRFDDSGDYIETPTIFGNPTGLTFWIKGQQLSGSTLLIQGSTNAGSSYNITIGLATNISGSEDTYEYTIANTNINKIKFTYNKAAGNLSFDDFKVFGTFGGVAPPAQSVFIDNIYVGIPTEYRNQNFDAWSTQTSYGTHKFQGWTAGVRAIIDTNFAYQAKVVRLDNTPGGKPYLQSPPLTEGIGTLSFRYRHWDGTPALTLLVQMSANSVNWVTITNLSVSSTTYQTFERLVNSYTNFAVRLLVDGGADRLLIDDVVIGKPQPAATLSIDASISPTAPYTNDPVHILANYSPSFGAQNVAMTSYYRVGTSGVFTAIPMAITNFIQFGTVTPIPKQTTNTIVQYYIRASFTGPGSDVNSPIFYPPGGSNSPASYGIPRDPPGSVWINEVKYNDLFSDTNFYGDFASVGFVELAGKAEIVMDGWKLQFYLSTTNSSPLIQASYNLTGQAIPDDIGGYGFWVIGTEGLPGRYMTLTNYLYQTPLGIRLINEKGFIIDAISFGGTMPNFVRVSANDFDQYPGTTGVSRIGFGFTRDEFSWLGGVENTPGQPNQGQFFELVATNLDPPPDLDWMVVSNGVMYMWSVANTSMWNAAPYYTTNLVATPQNWTPVTPFSSFPSSGSDNGTNRMWFTIPTNLNAAAYRIRFTQP